MGKRQKSRLETFRAWGGRQGTEELWPKGYRVSVWSDEKILEIVVLVVQHYEFNATELHTLKTVKIAKFMFFILSQLKSVLIWGVWLAHLVEHVTVDLRVVSLSPMLGVEIT